MRKRRFLLLIVTLIFSVSVFGSMKNMIFDQPTNFRGIKVADAFAVLTEDTGVNFVIEDPYKEKILDNVFVGGESLEEIVNVIANTNGMRVREIGNNIFLLEGKAAATNPGASSIIGTVRTSNLGVGIDGAKVTVLNSGLQPVTTSYGGKFILNGVLPGTYIMKVERMGYDTEGSFITVGKEDKILNIDMHRSGEKIAVTRNEGINSRVLGRGNSTITEQVNLLNIGAEEARKILLDLMNEKVSTVPGISGGSEGKTGIAPTTIVDAATGPEGVTLPGIKSMENFRAIPVVKQNMLILSGTPEQMKLAKNLIQIIDRQSKQVRIAAQVIEITDNLFENLGFSWAYSSGSLKPNTITNPNYPNSDNDITVPGGSNSDAANNANGIQKGAGTVFPMAINLFRYFSGKNDFLNFSINMLQATQDAVVSAIPSILVVNGETGIFKVTDESIVSYDSTITDNGIQSYTANLGEAGVILTVTPIIRDDDSIQLKIKVEVSKFLADATAAKPDEGFANPKSQRIVETIVNIHNGDTIFIGGMKQATINNGKSKVPFLGDLPGVGILFQNTDVGTKVNDLYIKLKIDIANHENIKHQQDLKGFMMTEIHNANTERGGDNINTTLYPQFSN